MTLSPSPDAARQIAPGGKLRVALNLANPLLAEGGADNYKGVTVDMSRELAKTLGVDVEFQGFDAAGKVVEALKAGSCDVAFMAIDPSRAADFIFSPAYMLIEAAYAVPQDSEFKSPADIDATGVRVISADGAAYTQFLSRTLERADLVPSKDPFGDIIGRKAEVVAGIRQPIAKFTREQVAFRMIADRFMEIPQGVAVLRGRDAAADFVNQFVEEMKASGMVAESLRDHGHHDAVVAPARAG